VKTAQIAAMKLDGQTGAAHHQDFAFALAEVLVAVLVLAIIALAFYGALSSGFSVTQTTREDLRATQILMQKAEAIRLCTWDQLTNFTFQEQYDPTATSSVAGGVVYNGTVSNGSATNIPNSAAYAGNVRLITLTVGWTNYNGRSQVPHTRQIQTQVARYGLQNYIWGATE
jgi:Tfp pilus assembly protein PilV